MAEASESRLRPFAGELFLNPAPLELSFSECRRCDYCFAYNNGRQKQKVDPGPALAHLNRILRHGGNPLRFEDRLLDAGFPIVFSNSVDPLWFQNLASTRAVLPLLQKAQRPVIFQTRGTDRPEDFPEYLKLVPEGSLVYFSLTTESEAIRREMERGAPSHEKRCEMIAMAAAAGFPVVAALNPIDAGTVGDLGRFFDVIDSIAGAEAIAGAWVEPLHLSRKQYAAIQARHPDGLPVVYGEAVERAVAEPWVLDGYFFKDVFAEIDKRKWRLYSGLLRNVTGGRADLFDLWPNPFPTHHALVEACREVSANHGGAPVGVTFDVACSWLDQGTGILDWELRRKCAWYLLNQKQNVDKAERDAIVKSLSLREILAFFWNHPLMRAPAWFGAYGLKALAELTPDAKALLRQHADAMPAEPVLDEDELREVLGHDPVQFLHRGDDDHLLAVWAPDLGAEKVIGEGELDDARPLVLLESFEDSLADDDAA